jgi:UDP-N-acetylglucosamine 2-epimerase
MIISSHQLEPQLATCARYQSVGYIDFIKLMQNTVKIVTDSGGVQKEAYLLAIPRITIRKTTESIETVDGGWNKLTDIASKTETHHRVTVMYFYPFTLNDTASTTVR